MKAEPFAKKFWQKFNCYIIFTIAFIPVAIYLDYVYRDAGMNFIRITDGIAQHFNTFLYTKKYISGIVSSLLRRDGAGAPLLNYTIGQGSDVITTLNGYDFINPVCIISIILFRNNLIFAYEFMIILNMYLSGIAFLVYCRTVGRGNEWTIASGALIYAFCGYSLHFGTAAPIFMSGMLFLPLILAGTEQFIRKRQRLPLILAVCFSLMVNYFTFYMNVIFLAVYLLIRCFPCPKNEIKNKIILILETAGVTIVGGLLSAVWLLPAIFGALMSNGGYQLSAGYTDSMIFYPPEYYRKLVEYFTYSADGTGYWNYLGFVPAAMFAVWALFMSGRKNLNKLRVAVCLGFLGMCIPIVGLALNGFRYVNNRWSYAFALIVAFTFVETSKELYNLKYKQFAAIMIGIIGIAYIWFNDPKYNNDGHIPLMLLVLTAIVAFICSRPYVPKQAVPILFVILITFSSIADVVTLCKVEYDGYVTNFCNAAEGYGIYAKHSSSRVAGTADDDTFYRIEMQEERPNTEGFANVHGTTKYFSVMDDGTREYYDKLQITSQSHRTQVYGLSGSRALLDLASVRYFTLPDETAEDYVPFGFTEVGDCVYENQYYLPSAFLYKNYLTIDDFYAQNPVDRQQIMLQGAVLYDTPQAVAHKEPIKRGKEIEYTIISDNASWENGWLSVGDGGGMMTLCFDPVPDCELYLWFDNLQLREDMSKRDITVSGGYRTDDEIQTTVSKHVTMSSPRYSYYLYREGVNFNLGYSEEGYDCCTVNFDEACGFSCDGIHLFAVPMSTVYLDDLENLRSAACDGIAIGNDRVTGTVTCGESSILQISVPYSIGWRAYVDGKKVPVLKSNLMYTGIELAPGTHEIKMKYCTPYLKAGGFISLLTLAGMIAFTVIRKRKH